MYEKLKSLLMDDHIFFGLIVFIVAVASFGLGRISVNDGGKSGTGVKLVNSSTVILAPEALPLSSTTSPVKNIVTADSLVASKSGTKYHFISCPGAKQIKESNKIFFSSKEEAQAAGYKPAANCPGLQ